MNPEQVYIYMGLSGHCCSQTRILQFYGVEKRIKIYSLYKLVTAGCVPVPWSQRFPGAEQRYDFTWHLDKLQRCVSVSTPTANVVQ